MSQGIRIPLDQALAVAKVVGERWGFDDACHIVGSVRRRRTEIVDLDLLAPAMPLGTNGTRDVLCERIQSTMQADGLFGSHGTTSKGQVFGHAVRGLKPGFLAASMMVTPWPGVTLPVQVFRYTPDNLGWMLIERTGPREFGIWFLTKWKARFGIGWGDQGKASIEGHLVDGSGKVVSVTSEQQAFDLIQCSYIEPAMRDRFVERQAERSSR